MAPLVHRAAVLIVALGCGGFLTGCGGAERVKGGGTTVTVETGNSNQELSFGVTSAASVYTDIIITRMQMANPSWHIFLIANPNEPRNADVIVNTMFGKFGPFREPPPQNTLRMHYGIQALSAYTKEELYYEEIYSSPFSNPWKGMGQMLRANFYPGSTLHQKVMAQRAESLKRKELAKPSGSGISKAEMQSLVTEAVAAGQAAPAKPAPEIHSDVDASALKLAQRPDDFAIVMGISKYSDLPEAAFAERDAQAVKNHLLAMGYPSRNVVSLLGEKAGFTALQKFLEVWLPKNVTPNSRVFFYFSGHGAPDPSSGASYLVPWDGDPSFLENTAYPVKRLYEKLGGLKVKQVIVALDACFSGAGGRSVLAKGARPLVTKTESVQPVADRMTVFAATGADQITTVRDDQGHGTFTYHFLKGLGGAAADADGVVRAKKLFDYLASKVQDDARRQNREQTPAMLGSGSAEEIVRLK